MLLLLVLVLRVSVTSGFCGLVVTWYMVVLVGSGGLMVFCGWATGVFGVVCVVVCLWVTC